MERWKLLLPVLTAFAVLGIIVADNVIPRNETGGAAASQDDGDAAGATDPVCHMLVGRQIPQAYAGRTYYFCAPQCREAFLEEPQAYLTEACLVCEIDDGKRMEVTGAGAWRYTWRGKTYRFCGEAHRDAFAADPGGYFLHRMWGLPGWLYYLSIGIVLLVSFGLLEWLDRRKAQPRGSQRVDLFRRLPLKVLLTSRGLRFAVQAVIVALFLLIVAAGLFGNQNPATNIAPILTWTIWWAGLVVFILFAGKAWCWMCPWDALSSWVERLSFWRYKRFGLSLNAKWPKALRNIVLATVLFVALTWVELGFGVTLKPAMTAYLALGMLAMALAALMLFERKAFCRYACLVGRVSGLYALFSPVELRARDAGVCGGCKSKDCYTGNENGDGCPTMQFPSKMDTNTYCTLCMECLHTCPHDNMTLNWRPWAADLEKEGKPRTDEAYLALLMLSITGFHGLTMTGLWVRMTESLSAGTGLGYMAAFSLAMFGLLAAPIVLYALLVKIACFFAGGAGGRKVAYRDFFIRYAYALLPIALFYHLAHNAGHLLMEGQKAVPMLSNPFGYAPGQHWSVMGFSGEGAWNLFGTESLQVPPLVSLPSLWLIQVLLILVGHLYSLYAAQKVGKQIFGDAGRATRSQIPMLAAMILFSIFSLWLLKQPMEMRLSAM